MKVWFLVFLTFTAQGAEKLLWPQCAVEAAAKNYDVLAAQQAVDAAKSRVRASYSPFLPQISADAGYARSNGSTDSTGLTLATGSTRQEYSYGLSAKQSLFSGFRDKAGMDRAKLDLEVAEANLKIAKAKLSSDLKSAFAQALYGEDQIKLAKEIEIRRKGNLDLVELRFESGRENRGSYLRSRAYLRQAQYETAQGQRALRVFRQDLLRLLARPDSTDIDADGDLTVPKLATPGRWDDLALQTPQYAANKAQAASAEKAVTVAEAQFFPELALTGAVGRRGASFPPSNDRWSLGVTLSLPLFPGGKNIFDSQTARAEERKAQFTFQGALSQLIVTLQDAYAKFQDAVERTEVQDEFLKAAQLRAEVARTKYTTGLLSFEDWDLIENDLINTQKSRLQSLRDAWLTEATWEQAQGKGVIP